MPITSQQVTSSSAGRAAFGSRASPPPRPAPTRSSATRRSTWKAHEPAPNVSPIFFPASPFTLEHSLAFGNERDYLNVSDQFRPTGSGPAGVQRHFTGGTFEVFYSQSADQVAPLISQVNVSDTSGVATVTARVSSDSGHVAEVAALVNDGHWHYLQPSQSPQGPDAWTGTISVALDPGGVRRGHRRRQRELQREQGPELHLDEQQQPAERSPDSAAGTRGSLRAGPGGQRHVPVRGPRLRSASALS